MESLSTSITRRHFGLGAASMALLPSFMTPNADARTALQTASTHQLIRCQFSKHELAERLKTMRSHPNCLKATGFRDEGGQTTILAEWLGEGGTGFGKMVDYKKLAL